MSKTYDEMDDVERAQSLDSLRNKLSEPLPERTGASQMSKSYEEMDDAERAQLWANVANGRLMMNMSGVKKFTAELAKEFYLKGLEDGRNEAKLAAIVRGRDDA